MTTTTTLLDGHHHTARRPPPSSRPARLTECVLRVGTSGNTDFERECVSPTPLAGTGVSSRRASSPNPNGLPSPWTPVDARGPTFGRREPVVGHEPRVVIGPYRKSAGRSRPRFGSSRFVTTMLIRTFYHRFFCINWTPRRRRSGRSTSLSLSLDRLRSARGHTPGEMEG